ncbi:16S rRNA (guanine(966)-N(2))-methyltransferase RsmD [Scopulibacillus daqui]|uniref:16S rRNA (Guanine(966)-N(2))-methyltransferase RsmD n=1 Tax=Scopulibacillus daqui TaxID=1469162 RepID=A0ABS2PWJ9_9BACL|nr:16S rRNA (guanine(966)-N(2))-methyltransferase RsmD [Scopulibacillus daqui]
MRVIAGECKGRPLKSVRGQLTRPTTDKVKETIFNMIGPFFDGGQALDLYSGSGGLGIEALSRGISHAIFIDRYGPAISTIKKNIQLCKLESRAEVYRNDVSRALSILGKKQARFRLIFMDPPYARQQIVKDIESIIYHRLLEEDGKIIVEHEDTVCLPGEFNDALIRVKHHTYHGKTAVSIYEKQK